MRWCCWMTTSSLTGSLSEWEKEGASRVSFGDDERSRATKSANSCLCVSGRMVSSAGAPHLCVKCPCRASLVPSQLWVRHGVQLRSCEVPAIDAHDGRQLAAHDGIEVRNDVPRQLALPAPRYPTHAHQHPPTGRLRRRGLDAREQALDQAGHCRVHGRGAGRGAGGGCARCEKVRGRGPIGPIINAR